MTFSLSAPLFVEVAVPLPIDHPFTYRVPFGEVHRNTGIEPASGADEQEE